MPIATTPCIRAFAINKGSFHSNDAALARPMSRTAGSRLSYTPPSSSSHSNMGDATNASVDTAVRRSRAGTMPSSTLPPFMGLGSSNLYIAQERPNHNRTNSMNTGTPPPAMYSRSGMSSPLDENASNAIASTLASLGLHDDAPMTNNSSSSSNHTGYFEPVARNRAFTVSMADNHRAHDMMSFSPFPQQQQQQQQHQKMPTRPRAISLGMMDSPLTPPQLQQQQPQPFLPFDMDYAAPSDYQNVGSTNSSLTDEHGNNNGNTSLPLLYHQSRLFARMDSHEEEEGDDYHHHDMEPPAQTPSRALWLGNVNPSLSVPDLHKMFARYGHVESARILSDKECAFVNFETVESALAAKEDLVNRLGSKVAGSVVKVGFGKADVGLAMALTQEAGPNAQGPTRALWVGNIPANINPAVLRSLFQSFGSIESIRILSHKNCGFVNFERQEDAVRARKQMQNKEILGPGTGTVRIGFAKAPTNNPDEIIQDVVISGNTVTSYATPASNKASLETSNNNNSSSRAKATAPSPSSSSSSSSSLLAAHKSTSQLPQDESAENAPNTSQWATVILMASMMMSAQKQQNGASTPTAVASAHPSPSNSTTSSASKNSARLASERKMIMQQLGYEPPSDEYERPAIHYYASIPAVPEFDADRHLGPMRLREIKKALDNGQGLRDVDAIAYECMSDIVELCSDYIGNTVIQKLFEHCGNDTKLVMLKKIAPYLASIGVHKNGTWAAQKIIDTASTDQQIHLICTNIAPYVPLLLLDQFGNYVVQCCLRMGPTRNQYIFDAIVDQCWEIGQGRFGARAVRAILENPIVTKDQQIYVAAAIMQNALLLTTNANGSILLNWLLDTSGLLGHYRALCNIN
ncbi:hypothetical protein MBANPS3_006586 [Mucor bainieri]